MKIGSKSARIGVASLLLIAIAAACFPAMRVFGSVAVGLTIVAYFTFALAIVGCLYSIISESPKVFGGIGLAVALVTILMERGTLYFAAMGILLLPAYGFAYMLFIIVRRLFRPEPLSER